MNSQTTPELFSFEILYSDQKTKARIGRLTTVHGTVNTPAFVPVGTQATVKSLTPDDLTKIGVEVLFGNTYHLHLRPGEDIIDSFGGLGSFMGFPGVTMTDSGGFQVFSLARNKKFGTHQEIEGEELVEKKLVKITEDGVEFRSHLDGSKHFFTPEQSIAIQKQIGADIMLAFDDCPPFPITFSGAKSAMERTHRWLDRSIEAFSRMHSRFPQTLYGIVQGSVFEELRRQSAEYVTGKETKAIAIGGVAVGEGKAEMAQVVSWVQAILPEKKLKHLLGVGDIDDIFTIIALGIDTFDCVTPTRLGRVGQIFISPPEGKRENRFRLDITKSLYARSSDSLDSTCLCRVCEKFTRGYIHHLFRARELLGYQLATYHNVSFVLQLVSAIRTAIREDRFLDLKKIWLENAS